MSYKPLFTITPVLLARVERIAALRERIQGAVSIRITFFLWMNSTGKIVLDITRR